jgi:hypothetical protein
MHAFRITLVSLLYLATRLLVDQLDIIFNVVKSRFTRDEKDSSIARS